MSSPNLIKTIQILYEINPQEQSLSLDSDELVAIPRRTSIESTIGGFFHTVSLGLFPHNRNLNFTLQTILPKITDFTDLCKRVSLKVEKEKLERAFKNLQEINQLNGGSNGAEIDELLIIIDKIKIIGPVSNFQNQGIQKKVSNTNSVRFLSSQAVTSFLATVPLSKGPDVLNKFFEILPRIDLKSWLTDRDNEYINSWTHAFLGLFLIYERTMGLKKEGKPDLNFIITNFTSVLISDVRYIKLFSETIITNELLCVTRAHSYLELSKIYKKVPSIIQDSEKFQVLMVKSGLEAINLDLEADYTLLEQFSENIWSKALPQIHDEFNKNAKKRMNEKLYAFFVNVAIRYFKNNICNMYAPDQIIYNPGPQRLLKNFPIELKKQVLLDDYIPHCLSTQFMSIKLLLAIETDQDNLIDRIYEYLEPFHLDKNGCGYLFWYGVVSVNPTLKLKVFDVLLNQIRKNRKFIRIAHNLCLSAIDSSITSEHLFKIIQSIDYIPPALLINAYLIDSKGDINRLKNLLTEECWKEFEKQPWKLLLFGSSPYAAVPHAVFKALNLNYAYCSTFFDKMKNMDHNSINKIISNFFAIVESSNIPESIKKYQMLDDYTLELVTVGVLKATVEDLNFLNPGQFFAGLLNEEANINLRNLIADGCNQLSDETLRLIVQLAVELRPHLFDKQKQLLDDFLNHRLFANFNPYLGVSLYNDQKFSDLEFHFNLNEPTSIKVHRSLLSNDPALKKYIPDQPNQIVIIEDAEESEKLLTIIKRKYQYTVEEMLDGKYSDNSFIKHLYNNQDSYTDLIITDGSEEIHVHQAIVCRAFKFFEAALRTGKEIAGIITFPPDDFERYKIVIDYLYKGMIPEFETDVDKKTFKQVLEFLQPEKPIPFD